MKAMIFAAGLGTRLYPLTANKPKALIEVNGITLLEILIQKLIRFGFNEVIINIHHFAGQVKDFVKSKNNFGIRIEFSDESDLLLDTGGGLKKASWFFNDKNPFLVHNVDIISDINFSDLIGFHVKNKTLATVCVKERESSRYLLFNDNDILSGWQNLKSNEVIVTRGNRDELHQLAFSGIHVINPEIFKCIGQDGVFTIIDLYLNLSKIHDIKAFRHDDDFIFDIGKPESLKLATKIKFQK